jgi:hypothetical protein
MARSTTALEEELKHLLEEYAERGELEELLNELDPAELEEMRHDPYFATLLPQQDANEPAAEDDDDSWLIEQERRRRQQEEWEESDDE